MRALVATLICLVSATGARAEPAVPRNPDLATQGMMLHIADRSLPLSRFIDERAGVVLLDRFEGPAGEDAPPQVEKLFCGRALTRLVRDWQRRASDPIGIPSTRDNDALECRNRPGPPTCTFGRSMEWDPAIHFVFRLDPDRGLLLRAITVDDEVLVDPREIDKEHRAQARLIESLAKPGCPAS
ncbi:MAG TPA: hypothetical protein VIG06_01235 [Kofleriaceae bacterium]|jgi:hypothetical protein